MDFKTLILLANTFFNLGLGVVVWIRGATNQLRKVFIIFSVAIALWSFGLAMFFFTREQSLALFWAKVLYFAGSLIALSLCYFSFIFPSAYLKKNPLNIVKRVLILLSLSIFLLTLLTNSVLKGVLEGVNKGLTYDRGYILWLLHFGLFMILAFTNLFIQFKRSQKVERLQIKYILIGTLSAAIFGSTTNVILPTLGNFKYFSIGPLLTISMAGFIAYAIIKHRFMDIRLLVARAVAYSLMITLIGVFYVGATFVLSTVFLKSAGSGNQLLLYMILTIIVALSFERFRHIIEKLTDKVFFKGRYDSSELLSRLGSIMSTNIELQPLTTQIIQTLIGQMKVSKGAFVILGEGLTSIYDIIDIGFPQRLTLSYDQISPFLPFSQIILLDELEENHLKSLMREIDISLVKTLSVKGDMVGLLILGEKASGEIYSQQDLKILEIIAPEVGVAIQNSQSYDKIKKFNVILSQEIRKATADLQHANTRLKQLDQLKDEFVSITSHELRTPMTAIRSYAWMALHRADVPLSKTVEKYVARILLSTERLINLVNDMLNVSRIESGRIEINPEPVDLLTLIKDIVDELYYSKSEEKQIEFVVLETQIPKVFADPEKLRQVFLNLVGNSLKFTPPGGKITFSFFTDGKVVETSATDTGVGIPKDDIPKLFHKFSRLDNSYTAAATSGGTGLGLYISKSLVELMHGKIWIRSEGEGKGATVTVSMPVASQEVLKDAEKYTVRAQGEVKGLEPVAI